MSSHRTNTCVDWDNNAREKQTWRWEGKDKNINREKYNFMLWK